MRHIYFEKGNLHGNFVHQIFLPAILAHLTALPLNDRYPSDARSCRRGGRSPDTSRKKKTPEISFRGSLHIQWTAAP